MCVFLKMWTAIRRTPPRAYVAAATGVRDTCVAVVDTSVVIHHRAAYVLSTAGLIWWTYHPTAKQNLTRAPCAVDDCYCVC